jgi:hypothetical protein
MKRNIPACRSIKQRYFLFVLCLKSLDAAVGFIIVEFTSGSTRMMATNGSALRTSKDSMGKPSPESSKRAQESKSIASSLPRATSGQSAGSNPIAAPVTSCVSSINRNISQHGPRSSQQGQTRPDWQVPSPLQPFRKRLSVSSQPLTNQPVFDKEHIKFE